jgi:hypothetical protein
VPNNGLPLFTNNIRAGQGILNTCAISLMDKCKGYLPQNNADRVMLPCPTTQGNPQRQQGQSATAF